MEPSPRLTVRGLLDEQLMEGARVVPADVDLDRALTWVLPLGEVMGRYDDLSGVAVYTRPEALTADTQAVSAIAARGAAALIVDGAAPTSSTTWPSGLPVIELDLPVGFAALNRLLAERSLTQEVHVMRYSALVHSTLAGLLHRGAGLALLIKEVSSLAQHPAWCSTPAARSWPITAQIGRWSTRLRSTSGAFSPRRRRTGISITTPASWSRPGEGCAGRALPARSASERGSKGGW